MATGQTAAKHLAINLIHTLAFIFFSFQNKCPEVEELVFSHFVICNDTQETLRFGQVDTDENILLASLHRQQYSWRSHRSPQVLEKPLTNSHCECCSEKSGLRGHGPSAEQGGRKVLCCCVVLFSTWCSSVFLSL